MDLGNKALPMGPRFDCFRRFWTVLRGAGPWAPLRRDNPAFGGADREDLYRENHHDTIVPQELEARQSDNQGWQPGVTKSIVLPYMKYFWGPPWCSVKVGNDAGKGGEEMVGRCRARRVGAGKR